MISKDYIFCHGDSNPVKSSLMPVFGNSLVGMTMAVQSSHAPHSCSPSLSVIIWQDNSLISHEVILTHSQHIHLIISLSVSRWPGHRHQSWINLFSLTRYTKLFLDSSITVTSHCVCTTCTSQITPFPGLTLSLSNFVPCPGFICINIYHSIYKRKEQHYLPMSLFLKQYKNIEIESNYSRISTFLSCLLFLCQRHCMLRF